MKICVAVRRKSPRWTLLCSFLRFLLSISAHLTLIKSFLQYTLSTEQIVALFLSSFLLRFTQFSHYSYLIIYLENYQTLVFMWWCQYLPEISILVSVQTIDLGCMYCVTRLSAGKWQICHVLNYYWKWMDICNLKTSRRKQDLEA